MLNYNCGVSLSKVMQAFWQPKRLHPVGRSIAAHYLCSTIIRYNMDAFKGLNSKLRMSHTYFQHVAHCLAQAGRWSTKPFRATESSSATHPIAGTRRRRRPSTITTADIAVIITVSVAALTVAATTATAANSTSTSTKPNTNTSADSSTTNIIITANATALTANHHVVVCHLENKFVCRVQSSFKPLSSVVIVLPVLLSVVCKLVPVGKQCFDCVPPPLPLRVAQRREKCGLLKER